MPLSSCNQLTISAFIYIITSNDLSPLGGGISKREYAWQLIWAEYTELTGDKKSNHLLSLMKEFYVSQHKIAIIQTIVDAICERHDDGLTAQLRVLGFRFKFDISQPEQYRKDLERTVTQSKSLIVRLNNAYNELQKLNNDNSKATPSDFDLIMAELSKFQGYRIDPNICTVSEYCAILNSFRRQQKATK